MGNDLIIDYFAMENLNRNIFARGNFYGLTKIPFEWVFEWRIRFKYFYYIGRQKMEYFGILWSINCFNDLSYNASV